MNNLDLNILLVDDEAELLEVMRDCLEHKGFKNIRTAVSGEVALEIFKKEHIDLIFCDLKMPYMNGLEFYQQLKTLRSAADFVLLTGSDIADIKDSSKALIDEIEVMKKPFEFSDIIKRTLSLKTTQVEAAQ